MPRFAANLSWLYQEHGLPERFHAAASDGFHAVEILFPYDWPAAELRRLADEQGLQCVLINAPCGNWAAGERGLAALPQRSDDFKRSLELALNYAHAMQTPCVHIMAGVLGPSDEQARCWDTYQHNLAWAANLAASADVTLTIEPINPIDMPAYLLSRPADALRIVREINSPQLGVQLDLYHCQMVEGEVLSWLTQGLQARQGQAWVKHLQVAGVPGRHEPTASPALDYPAVFQRIDQLGYGGWIGCEYRPRLSTPGGTRAGLAWLKPHLKSV